MTLAEDWQALAAKGNGFLRGTYGPEGEPPQRVRGYVALKLAWEQAFKTTTRMRWLPSPSDCSRPNKSPTKSAEV